MNCTKEYSSRLKQKSTHSRTLSAMVGAWAEEHGLELETIATS